MALAKAQPAAAAKARAGAKAHWWEALLQRKSAAPVRGLGAMDLSFSALDVKSMVLGGVLGLGLGVVLFRRK
jgi:hypothetical protein